MTGKAASKAKKDQPILEINGLSKWFPVNNAWKRRIGWLKALDDVSLTVRKGEIIGIVGESGCGKSTLGKTIMGIHPLTAGSVVFEGEEIGGLTPSESRQLRRRLQYTYQDPGSSLDPRWKIGRSLNEPLEIHTTLNREERHQRVLDILKAVNLPEAHLDLYPHEISGGQQRRIGLARILTLHPSLVVLDEPTSGLDVSVQATILNLFLDLQKQFDLTYMFISHDLSVVRMICDRVAVMYLGKIVELGVTEKIFSNPRHPYTRSLLSAIPTIGGRKVTEDFWLEGEPPDPGQLPSGCRFRTRCPHADAACATTVPPLVERSADHWDGCLHAAALEGS
jgi:oligopeptide transport system ATP-binding protein